MLTMRCTCTVKEKIDVKSYSESLVCVKRVLTKAASCKDISCHCVESEVVNSRCKSIQTIHNGTL